MFQLFSRDLLRSARSLPRSPAFSVISILILGLGIGGTASIFSIVDQVLLEPLPYSDSERLVTLSEQNRSQEITERWVAPARFRAWKERAQIFEGLFAFQTLLATDWLRQGRSEKVQVAAVEPGFFRFLGSAPLLGRTFRSEEADAQSQVLILSHSMWTSRFGSDRHVIGRRVELREGTHEIVGVLPEDFRFNGILTAVSDPGEDAFFFKPLSGIVWEARAYGNLSVIGRLRPNSTLMQARAEMDAIAEALAGDFPDTDSGWSVRVRLLSEQVTSTHRASLLLLLGAVFFVWLMACANVAGLLLVRTAGRVNDLAIRSYLGASKTDLFRQTLAESLILGAAGGTCGLGLAVLATRLLWSRMISEMPRIQGLEPGPPLLICTFVATLLASILCGLPAAIQSAQTSPGSALHRAGNRSVSGRLGTVRGVLVIGQVGASLVLLLACGLLLESLVRLNQFDLGFNPGRVVSLRVDLGHDSPWRKEFLRRFLERLEALPAVAAVGAVNHAPLESISDSFRLWLPGEDYSRSVDIPTAEIRAVSPGYFETVGITLERGRTFARAGPAGSEAVINQTMAGTYWPGRDAIGQSLSIDGPDGPLHRVVGIIRDSYYAGPDDPVRPELYLPYQSLPWPSVAILARGARDGLPLVQQIRSELQSLDPTLPPYSIATLDDRLADLLAPRRVSAALLSIFAATALLLMSLGLYGVVSSFVEYRTREIGIRLALGAQRWMIVQMVLRQGLTLVVLGLLLGGIASFATRGLLSSLLFETSPGSLLTQGVVFPLVLMVSLAACLIPVTRTFRIHPAEALRHE